MPKCHWVTLLGLVHLGVTRDRAVLGRAGCGKDGGIHCRACLEHQATLGQQRGDRLKETCGDAVCFQEVAKAQNGALIGQRLLHGQIRQGEPLLQAVDAQHGLGGKGWAPALWPRLGTVRLDERDKLGPGHHLVHLLQQHLLAGDLALFGKGVASGQAHLFDRTIVAERRSGLCRDSLSEFFKTNYVTLYNLELP